MNQEKYVIQYYSLPHVERASSKTMTTYLEAEKAAWAPFFKDLSGTSETVRIQNYQTTYTGGTLANIFDRLGEALDDPKKFTAINTANFRRQTVAPPPADSVEGRLVIGLHTAGRSEDALAAYVCFVWIELNNSGQVRTAVDSTKALIQRGDLLLTAAYAASALPVQKIVAAGLKMARDKAEQNLQALDAAVGDAEQVNAEHTARLSTVGDQFVRQAKKLKGIFVRAEQRRARRHRSWCEGIDAEVVRRFSDAETRIGALDKLAERQQKNREKEFQALKDLFHIQLRLRAPVALWEQRAVTHRGQANHALRYFWIAAAFAILVGILVPWLAGDYIAGSFTALKCLPGRPQSCVHAFSAKGPLTVAGILLTTSLILWVIRMQYRIFLSERHLSLDADERRAFAETYMALKEDGSVDISNETIVLASLFRPTQDGIIKDEDGGFDLSAAALLAKQLAK